MSFYSWEILCPIQCGWLGIISSYLLSLCSSLQWASWLIPVESFLRGKGQIVIQVFHSVHHFCKWQGISGWETNFLPYLLLVFWHVGVLFNGMLTWNKCPGLSWVLQGEDVFRNPATRALSGRVPGVKDLGGGRLQRTGTLGAGRGENPDSHSPLPLTSMNYQSHAFCNSLPRSFALLFLFP